MTTELSYSKTFINSLYFEVVTFHCVAERLRYKGNHDLTCHVAVYLCGPQGTTPIWINEVEARGAATHLVGLTGWLINGCKKQNRRANKLFLEESTHTPAALSCMSHKYRNHVYIYKSR